MRRAASSATRRSPCGRMRRMSAASTTMVMPPSTGLTKVLTSTCAPPRTRQATASAQNDDAGDQHQHERVDQPGHAHVGIDAGERRDQRAGERGEPGAEHEGGEPHPAAVDAEPARERLVHDHRARGQAEPGSLDQEARSASADRQRGERSEAAGRPNSRLPSSSTVPDIGLGHELHFAPERQRDQLADDDAEPPGRQDGVERAAVERAHDEPLVDAAEDQPRRRTRPAAPATG